MNDSRPGFAPDDQTRRLLAASDPARSLLPADPALVASLLEETMSQPQRDTSTARRPRTLLIGAAGVAAVVALTVGVLTHDSTRAPGVAARTVTKLSLPGAAGKCRVPTAELVGAQPLAFTGTVSGIADGLVTLRTTRFFAGAVTDLVTITEPDLTSSEMPVDFVVGKTYLVGATDGQVSICGLSGPVTGELQALYDQAFAK